jgi:hypothetical protein
MRKLWQETRDPECKTAVSWASKVIRRITRKNALQRWETKLANTEVTPQAVWPIAKFLANRNGPRAPTALHGLLGLKFHPENKAIAVVDCSENQFTPHDLCNENHERRVEARVQALLEVKIIRPCDLQKLINSLKSKKACEIDGIPKELKKYKY